MTGTSLAHYRVLEKLGSGGMGDVYRAQDEKLGRDVALKLLPERFSQDSERIARFQREARTLASLNHPNVAAVYGVEEADGRTFLVMELVRGETLLERIQRGPIPLEESLTMARQMADGLEEAHERGVVHRDLKPANVMIASDGKVKILDFGLARAFLGERVDEADLTNSPTITGALTQAHVILGTAGYMSPEQAKGKQVDRRTDLWAFGVVLWEMLSGKRLFEGEDASETIAAVLRAEIPWSDLPQGLPPAVKRLLERCLERDPRKRLRDIGEARVRLDKWTSDPGSLVEHIPEAPARRRAWLPWGIALAAIAAAVLGWTRRGGDETDLPVTRLSIQLPEGHNSDAGYVNQPLALSPDGRSVYCWSFVSDDLSMKIFRRSLDSAVLEPIADAWDVHTLAVSPDGSRIAYGSSDGLFAVSKEGGSVVDLAETGIGACWTSSGDVVFASGLASGLSRVSAGGGAVQELTVPDRERGEVSHRLPCALPGDRAALFTVKTDKILDFSEARIAAVVLETGEVRTILEGGSQPSYLPTGHLVYWREGSLHAVPFDPDRLEVTGTPMRLVENVAHDPASGGAFYAVSPNGTLIYVTGGSVRRRQSLVFRDPAGRVVGTAATKATFVSARISPDGRRAAIVLPAANDKIWLFDVERDLLTRLTFGGGNDQDPIWSSQGDWIYFSSDRGGPPSVFRVSADGGEEIELTANDVPTYQSDVSPDGGTLAFTRAEEATGDDIWMLPLGEGSSPELFLRTEFDEAHALFSPGGDWVLYESNETGNNEVFLRRYPGATGKIQVTSGGTIPGRFRWSAGGREILYRNGLSWYAIPVDLGSPPRIGKPRLLIEETEDWRVVDMTPDGGFLTVDQKDDGSIELDRIEVVLNWSEEVKRLVPGGVQ